MSLRIELRYPSALFLCLNKGWEGEFDMYIAAALYKQDQQLSQKTCAVRVLLRPSTKETEHGRRELSISVTANRAFAASDRSVWSAPAVEVNPPQEKQLRPDVAGNCGTGKRRFYCLKGAPGQ